MADIRVRLGLTPGMTHSLYTELLEAPPEGISYLTEKGQVGAQGATHGKTPMAHRLRNSTLMRAIADPLFASALPKDGKRRGPGFLAAKAMVSVAGGKQMPETDFDLFHSVGASMVENIPWIVENDVRWVVDMEHVASLFGYYGDWRTRMYRSSPKRVLTKQLRSHYCKRILPWTEAAMRTVDEVLGDKEVSAKTEVLPLAVRPAPEKPKDISNSDKVRILFIGSSNFKGEFWSKGGLEVLESYRLLRERVGDSVELIFRCWMPDELKSQYSSLPACNRGPIFCREKSSTDCSGAPTSSFSQHTTRRAWRSWRRCGSACRSWARTYGPTTRSSRMASPDSWWNLLRGYQYYLPGFVPNWSMDSGPFLPYMKRRDDKVVSDLADRLGRLVSEPSLRRSMGESGRSSVEDGKFSISNRNARLKKIYEESI